MYMEASSENAGSDAELESAMFKGTSAYMCLTFYYHMNGIDMGELKVKLVKSRNGITADSSDVIWTKSGKSDNKSMIRSKKKLL